MPNTTANFDIPFLDGTELVRDYPQFSEDLADAVDAGLVSARGLVAVKSAIFTGIQDSSVVASGNVAVTDLSITHEVADSANKLIISAFIGATSNSAQRGQTGIAVAEDGTLIGVGAAAGARVQIGAGGITSAGTLDGVVSNPSVTFVHTPGAGSKTYTVRAVNINNATRTLFINRDENDSDAAFRPRAVSSIVIQEVAV